MENPNFTKGHLLVDEVNVDLCFVRLWWTGLAVM